VTHLRVSDVATLLRVSDDTVRRWIDQGRLAAERDEAGRKVVRGEELASFVRGQRAAEQPERELASSSARNRFDGVVTDVRRDGLMAQVEIQAGPFRVVSLMTREAADDLGLEPGSIATAVVKSTNVIVQAEPRGAAHR
jgi:molybdopterin-binding protein